MTLREDVVVALQEYPLSERQSVAALYDIAALLEATGAPAYIRVAKDLRGEWVEGEDA